MNNSFNSLVGLNGLGKHSSITGDFTTLLAGYASTTSTTSGGVTSTSTLTSKLSALQTERTTLSKQIVTAEAQLAWLVQDRGKCKRTFGWDNSCLDNNTRLQNEQNSLITSYKNRIAAIDLEIPKIQSEIAIAQKAQQEAAAAAAELERQRLAAEAQNAAAIAAATAQTLAAQAAANPEIAALQAQAAIAAVQAETLAKNAITEATSEKSKMMLYLGAGIVALVIVAGVVMYIFKK